MDLRNLDNNNYFFNYIPIKWKRENKQKEIKKERGLYCKNNFIKYT